MQHSRGRRRGSCFTVRISDEERATLEAKRSLDAGPKALGPWLVWRALNGESPSVVVPAPAAGLALPELVLRVECKDRIVLDLCGGSGSWSRSYVEAGYDVRVVSLPHYDVRTYVPPLHVWGVLAAPPCTEFSVARNGHPEIGRDFVEGMACVNACLRIVLQCRPRWWALENPAGYLGYYLGPPRDTFEPHDFGDAWTKRTCLWGDFAIPKRGPFVKPTTSAAKRSTAAARAITPPGFARAFFEANR